MTTPYGRSYPRFDSCETKTFSVEKNKEEIERSNKGNIQKKKPKYQNVFEKVKFYNCKTDSLNVPVANASWGKIGMVMLVRQASG